MCNCITYSTLHSLATVALEEERDWEAPKRKKRRRRKRRCNTQTVHRSLGSRSIKSQLESQESVSYLSSFGE